MGSNPLIALTLPKLDVFEKSTNRTNIYASAIVKTSLEIKLCKDSDLVADAITKLTNGRTYQPTVTLDTYHLKQI